MCSDQGTLCFGAYLADFGKDSWEALMEVVCIDDYDIMWGG